MQEFELINRYFTNQPVSRRDVELGMGDDCALVNVPEGFSLAVTTDTLVAGVHFFDDISPKALGHRAIAVNLSDLAAMGAEPRWLSVSLTLPHIDPQWVEQFAAGMHAIASYFNVQIIGGDTSQGPLSVTVCAKGTIPQGKALTRSGAKNGDWIYVTGELGDAGVAIDAQKQQFTLEPEQLSALTKKLEYPTPRVAAGQALRGLASAAIDISDGLLADLQHILTRSGVGASIKVDAIPVSAALEQSLPLEQRWRYVLAYGDDYELLFTVPENHKAVIHAKLQQYGVEAVCIGQITNDEKRVALFYQDKPFTFEQAGFEHFSESSK